MASRVPLFGWLMVAVGTAIIVIINGTFYSYGVFFRPLLDEFGWARAVLSGPVSLRLLATGFFGIIAGAIVDKAGPRWVVTIGVALVGLGYLLTAGLSDLWELYVYLGLVSGIGMSVPYPAITSIVSKWFTVRRGLAMGIILAGYGIGQVIFPPLASSVIAALTWRPAFIIMALIIGLIAVPLGFLLKLPSRVAEAAPASDSPGPGTGTVPLHPGTAGPQWNFKDGVRTVPLWQIGLVYLLFSVSLQALMVHLVPHAIDIGIDPISASILLTIIGASNAVGRIGVGALSDKFGAKQAMILSIILPAVTFPTLIFADSLLSLYLISAVYGIGYGGLSSTVPKLTSEYYGLRSLGAFLGIIQLTFAIGGAIGAPLTGYIFDVTRSYNFAFMLLTVLLATAFVLCLSIHPPLQAVPSASGGSPPVRHPDQIRN